MKELTCIRCPQGCRLSVDVENGFAVTGNRCPMGAEYGKSELTDPRRTVTTTVALSGGAHPRLPVRTSAPVRRDLVPAVMAEAAAVSALAPVAAGQVLIENIACSGADLVSERAM